MAVTLVRGGQLIDGVSPAPIPDGYVSWQDGRITAVGRLQDMDPTLQAAADTVIDATGKTILPGLVNAHEHLDDRRTFGSFQARMERPKEMLLLGAARSTLASLSEGFTTVRDCGGV